MSALNVGVKAIFLLPTEASGTLVELTRPQLIWNRALGGEAASLLSGDLALAEMLLAHGYVMNGGVFHAVEGIDAECLAGAEAGYRYFEFDDVADLLNETKSLLESVQDLDRFEIELRNRYTASIPDDLALFRRFEDCLHRNPSEFAPI